MKIGITDYADAALDQTWRQHLDRVAGVILITKAPHLLGEIPERSVVHCTITGWGNTRMERGVVEPYEALAAYDRLIEQYGPERIVLRVDPIFPSGAGFQIARKVLCHAKGRVRISFLDAYRHTRERIRKAYGTEVPWDGLHAPLELRKELLERIRSEVGIEPEICAEPGLPCTGCISERDMLAMGLACKLSGKCRQRTDCHCAAEKYEMPGAKKRCFQKCCYCFWRD